ncbi:MAG: DUF560 domain-containing protein [Betaproteobacteria bacterium]|nr:DUF560 domain-containing protein [Betaproteobacteria bacterium]
MLAATALAAAISLPAQAAPADDLKALLDQGKAAEAYALGRQHPDQLGNPAFDFYFGVAAIDAGHAGEGVLALERYIANFPDNRQARLELARGYFVLGDDARAREEFDAVRKTSPPADVEANIQRFMDSIRARESRYRTTAGFYAEAGVGTDSNVNGGVGSANINLPVFGPVTLLSGVKTGDTFSYFAAGGNVSYPVVPGVALFGSASADGKFNRHDSAFDQTNVNLAGGVSYLRDRNLFRLTGTYGELALENDTFRKVAGATGEVSHQLDELQMLNGYVQVARLDYPGANRPRNADLLALGAGYRRAFIGKWQPLMTLQASIGEERNQQSRPDLGRRFYGGRAALATTPAPRWSLSAGATYQSSKYDGPDPLLGVVRKDSYYGLDAFVSYALTRNWSVRGEYQFTDNKSNIALYESDRHLFMLKLRYEFK